ncbi:hypothetical protein ICN48_10430 [Polynucleobacter sp. JS-Safj-400b-B2]|uniref:hypothetical protein n=1 Tax=Polynucleobacter sp. JS-Safj-400b-B2 TaxID=2576921 RepID=UPI001C0A9D6A|nr:hypothetical protein [Polynucleobacter sp. JS-Safj-400b-B2]MBU3626645.1 hypothetical protein [Polynucleobacter sp. JS-Safj-400b-B2]
MATKKNPPKTGTKAPQAASRAGVSNKNRAVVQKAAIGPSVARQVDAAPDNKTTDSTENAAAKAPSKVPTAKSPELKKGPKESNKANEAINVKANDKMNGKVNGKTNGKSNGKSNDKDDDHSLLESSAGPIPKAETGLEKDLVKKPAGSLKSPLRIFQIYNEPWQRDLLDANFSPLDNSKNTSELMDFAVFEQLMNTEYVKDAQLWGTLSWRFAELTGMGGADWVKSIQAHPGNDVYFCNPYPQIEALYHNSWLQGETAHPQFFALSQAVFQVTGLPVDELTSLSSSEQFSATNFLVATPKFWAAYLPWVRDILSLANKKLPPKVRDLMHSPMADKQGIHNGATYVPFIVERLFPVFMKTAGKSMKSYKIALPERERELNVHLKLLREMKDVAHRTKSAWLGVCWVNYRNLYLTQINGKEWAKTYLRTITPTDIKFS